MVSSARSNKLQEKDVKEKETRENEVKKRGWQGEDLDDNGIDQSQVAFKDLKAKFQEKADNDFGVSFKEGLGNMFGVALTHLGKWSKNVFNNFSPSHFPPTSPSGPLEQSLQSGVLR